jgi:glycosyltransferase involved in cell wall biosynthesis
MHSYFQRLLGHKKKSKPISLFPKDRSLGTVVLSYLQWPFMEGYNSPRARGHTNAFEVVAIARAYQDLGYRVDVIDHDDASYIPSADCCVVIDLHGQLEQWHPLLPKQCHRILHATGAHWLTANQAELARLAAIRDRRSAILFPRRQTSPSRSAAFADQIVVLGNDYTMESFQFANKPLKRIPISSAYEFSYPQDRDFSVAKKNFLWMGSYGMVHKGLDLVLEAFARLPELTLTVCGRPEKEDDFFRLYEKELLHTPNIKFHGWVDMTLPEFRKIAETHASIVYPSSSEGGGGCVIHAMHAGMVPLCTREASVDLGDFGVPIKHGTVEAVMEAVLQLAAFSDQEVKERAVAAFGYVRAHHTREQFEKNYRTFATNLLR